MPQENKKELMLEERKVKNLEKIANVLDALTLWFEDIDKEDGQIEHNGIWLNITKNT